MARALAEFYTDVLAELGVTGPDNTASAEDVRVVTDAYAPLWAMLDERDLLTFGVADDVPDMSLLPMRWIVAFHLAPVFGITGAKLEMLQERGQIEGPAPSLGERMLRKQTSPDAISAVQATEYF